jgi:RIO1 family
MMIPTYRLLALDMGIYDCFYRFRRDSELTSAVVYVHLQALDIIAENTYGPAVIKGLRNIVDIWDGQWITLTVFREGGKIYYTRDQWKPHSLPAEAASGDLPRLNFVDLEIGHQLKNRAFQLKSDRQILKICPFAYELPYFTQEIKTYTMLSQRECRLIPRLSAYVYERSEDQIVGFVCEKFQGRVPGPDDHGECRRSLQDLHSYGVVHGDVNKFNILITVDGPRFFDLEKSVLDTDEISLDKFTTLQEEELNKLEKALKADDGWGEPWRES